MAFLGKRQDELSGFKAKHHRPQTTEGRLAFEKNRQKHKTQAASKLPVASCSRGLKQKGRALTWSVGSSEDKTTPYFFWGNCFCF
jgi:hypothetical protein